MAFVQQTAFDAVRAEVGDIEAFAKQYEVSPELLLSSLLLLSFLTQSAHLALLSAVCSFIHSLTLYLPFCFSLILRPASLL